jgi:hypothetical protein
MYFDPDPEATAAITTALEAKVADLLSEQAGFAAEALDLAGGDHDQALMMLTLHYREMNPDALAPLTAFAMLHIATTTKEPTG